jgi:DNA polymerase III subunit alpha
MVFAESFAQISERYPGVLAKENVCFVRGRIDKKREVPSLLVNEVIPIADAIGRLTTAVAIKLDPTRHTPEVAGELEEVFRRHKGGVEVFLQVATGPESKVVMRLDKERFVRPTCELADDLEMLLGSGSVQFCGLGTKRLKRQQQQQELFREESAADDDAAPALPPAADEAVAAVLDMELEMEEASS